MMKFWREHSLTIVLVAILLAQTVVFAFTGYEMWAADQRAHGEQPTQAAWWTFFTAEMHVSILADTYGAILLVVLTKRLRERNSEESK